MSSNASISGRATWLLVAVAIACAGFFAYRPFLGLAFLGLDTYPMIWSGRILTPADFAGTFTEELMDGLYPDGHFYRPVANLFFALDYALWKLSPRGYHITDLAILITNAVLLAAFTRRLFGARAIVAALVAGLSFALHPIQLEIQPIPPRRADALCCTFLLAALLAQPRTAAPARVRTLLGALFVLLAAGSKESGAIAVPLIFTLHALSGEAATTRKRLTDAAQKTAAPLVALALYIAARTAVLGGLGGHSGSSLDGLLQAPQLAGEYVERVLYPQPLFGGADGLGPAFTWTLLVLLSLSTFAIWRWPGTSVVAERREVRTGFAFLGIWTICVLAISSLAGRVHDWYAMLFLAPYAVLLGTLIGCGLALVAKKRPLPALLPIAAAACALASHISSSSLVRTYPQWEQADELARAQITRFDRLMDQWRPGKAVLDRFVPWVPPAENGSGVRGAFLQADHSLNAYARLIYPSKPVHVDFYTGEGPLPPSPSADLLQVILFPGPSSALR